MKLANLHYGDYEMPTERWTATHVPAQAYDRLHAQLERAETLLREIQDGKHSLPGTVIQIDRYFAGRGRDTLAG